MIRWKPWTGNYHWRHFRGFFTKLHFLNIVEEPENVGIGPIAQGPEKGGGQEFSPTLFAVEVNEQKSLVSN